MKRSEPARAVVQFAVTGTCALLLLGFLAVTLLRNTGKSEAIRDAQQTTRLAGEGVVAPAITPALEGGDPRAIAAMDRLLRRSVLREPIVRVKIWNPAGKIIYSDRHELIGSGYKLGEDELKALRTGTDDAEVSDLSRPRTASSGPRRSCSRSTSGYAARRATRSCSRHTSATARSRRAGRGS